MHSQEIREKFFTFFTNRGHTQVPSSSLIPAQDPTLLFTNAGMNQFKDVFLGQEKRSYTTAVSIQKCIRAGGKHNDLDNVGFTKRHLTFFEMMGNFSFGNYFKKEAIRYAWEFLTKDMRMAPDLLYASVYTHDDEAYALWKNDIGLDTAHLVRLGAADNFWQMGPIGPCGPCSEIYIDRGPAFGCENCAPGCHCDRFLEVWNLVFMQYNRQPDGTDIPLQQTGVDTGMGLERLCSIMQEKDSVFETDLFEPLIKHIEKETGYSYTSAQPPLQAAFKVLADHIRSSSFAIADGCTPSNEGRGYVLRKIIRRAALFAQKLTSKNIFPSLVDPLVQSMGSIYPELVTQHSAIKALIHQEIDRFTHNLEAGKTIFEQYATSPDTQTSKTIAGIQAFKLYDTFGFPLELTKVLAQEQGMAVDIDAFEVEMEKQRIQSGKKVTTAQSGTETTATTEFVGYDSITAETKITGLMKDGVPVDVVQAGEQCWVITEKSPFFAACGGQVSDKGTLILQGASMPVEEVQKISNAITLKVKALTPLHKDDRVLLVVDATHRLNTMKNHTATHLLQAALIELLGKQVRQAGSLVDPAYLRFDFTYHENLTPEQITCVENRVNEKIMENIPVNIYTTDYKTAISRGVIAIFGEKYNPEQVRVIDVPGFSQELCGGTHVRATGDIGCFKITEISALSTGTRRIVAVTGPCAIHLFQETFNLAKVLSQEFKVKPTQVFDAVKKQQEQLKTCTSSVKELKKKLWLLQQPSWLEQMTPIHKIPFLYLPLKDATPTDLRDIAQGLVSAQQGLYFLTVPTPERIHVLIALSPALATEIDLIKALSWLKSQGFIGGGTKTGLQGSFTYIDQRFIDLFKEWMLAQHTIS